MKLFFTILLLSVSSLAFSQNEKDVVDSLFYGQNGIESKYPDVGLVIGVYHSGKASYYAFGPRTKEGTALLDSTSIFEIGSATKTFTALLLADEIQKKKIGKHDFIDNYLPKGFELPCTLQKRVKLTDLASHQSGLPNLSNDKYFSELLRRDSRNPFRFVDKDYLYEVLAMTDTLSGYRQYQYNNYAFSLLGNILERINEINYASMIKESILVPLKMNYTTFSKPNSPNVAGLYNQEGERQEYMILNAANPAGGIKSNAVDMIKYLKAHIASDEFDNAVKITQEVYFEDANRKLGLGWDIQDDYYQKDGDTFGNSCLMRYSKERDLAIVFFSNHQNGQLVRDAVDFIYQGLSN